MSIPDELAQAELEKNERIAANTAKGHLQNARSAMIEADSNIQAIVDEYGSFDTLPPATKQAYIATWNVVKAAKLAFEEPTITTLLDWRPE